MLARKKVPILYSIILILTITVIYFIFNTIPSVNYYSVVTKYSSEYKKLGHSPKHIILWTPFFNHADWSIGKDTVKSDYFQRIGCPETNCVITTNRTYLPEVWQFDAVVFHGAEEWPIYNRTPNLRSPHQKYVFGTMESPAHTKHNMAKDYNLFNWTMSYRLDSDILFAYAGMADKETMMTISPALSPKWKKFESEYNDKALFDIAKNKGKLAAWVVSHCNSISNRDGLVKSLQQYMPIDVYGSCGTLVCPRDESCLKLLEETYKFYFAFENSLCLDYVTEKLFRYMATDMVIVVYGGADYNRFVPPNSYINANDFDTSKDLADYLLYLDNTPEEYVKYFWWKQYYVIKSVSPFCQLCAKLNEDSTNNKIQHYQNLEDWWFVDICFLKPKIKF